VTPYDNASPAITDSTANGHSRSGSQKRQRGRAWRIALDAGEEAAALERASMAGLSKSAYGRFALLGTPGPRARRRPSIDAQLLGHAIAALNRAGNVANQIAHRLNAAQSVGAGETNAALAEIREAARAIREAAGYKDHHDHQGEPPR
jgi:hypothetical protein